MSTQLVRAPGPGLTDEQEAAVERRQGGLLLAANAGSGKTTVLVERFVRAVHDDGVRPSRILAITFTERAAGELRDRVRRRLHELGDRAAARETETAFVSTIHGFCARLLRAHPLAAGLAPGFGVLDDGTAAGLRGQAFDRAVSAWMVGPAELDLAAACGVDRLGEAISRAHDELRSRGMTRPRLPAAGPRHDAGLALARLVEAGGVLAGELEGCAKPGKQVFAAVDQLARLALYGSAGGGRPGEDGLGGAGLGGAGPRGDGPPGDGPHGDGPHGAGGHGDGRAAGIAFDEFRLPRGAGALKTAAADAFEAARVRCVEAADDAAGVVGLDLLGRLLDGFAGEFARLKSVRGGLDFDDLELSARDLLVGDAELRERWSERFELLMVDELQDTNPREMEILGALDRGNLFTVGDEFQSIYGFRHADVSIFQRRRRELAADDGVRALSRNFRSRPAILAAINAAFGPLFGGDFVPLVAGRPDAADEPPAVADEPPAVADEAPPAADAAPSALDAAPPAADATPSALDEAPPAADATPSALDAAPPAAEGTRAVDGGPAAAGWGRDDPVVELMLSDSAGWQETAPGDEPGPGPPWRRAEAVLLARRIAELIESRAAGPGEIVVLLRYATAAAVYGQALAELGIPVAAALGGGFYAAQEIADLGAYARVLANPLDDVALYGVLASPLCGLRADGLGLVAVAAHGLDRPPWEVLAAAGAGEPAAVAGLERLTADDRARLDRVRRLIDAERVAAGRVGLAELLRRSGYADRAFAGRTGGLGRANFHKLLRLAREFEAREGRDLRAFADRLAAGRLGSSRERHAQLADTDAVRLMTVHAAKGLEFPVVCVADLGHGPPIGAPVILTDGDRVGLRLPTLSGGKPAEAFAYTELRARQGRAAVAEEQRIAYVAMTRARDRLILSGAAHFAHWPTPGPFAAAIAWLGPAVVGDLADRLAGPTGVSEVVLGGARVRLTLTAAGDMPALRDVIAPDLARPTPPPADARPAVADYEQMSLFDAAASPAAPLVPAVARPARDGMPGAASSLDVLLASASIAARRAVPDPALAGGVFASASTPGAASTRFGAGAAVADASLAASGLVVGGVPDAWLPPAESPGAGRSTPGAGGGGHRSTPSDADPARPASLPPPGSVSYSSLVDYGRCGYGYYLRRVLGLTPLPPPPGLEPDGYDAAERGRVVHAMLERLDFGRPAPPSPAAVRAMIGGRAPGDDEVAAVVELVAAFARSPLCRRLAAARTVTREASFAAPVGQLLVNGFVDVLAGEDEGRMLVVDYKTDRIDPDTDLAGRVATDYAVQRQVYALAALRAGATAVDVAYCFLRRPDDTVSTTFAPADVPRLEAAVLDLAAPLVAGRFDVSPRPHRRLCATCPGRPRLCSWDELTTLSASPPEQATVHDA